MGHTAQYKYQTTLLTAQYTHIEHSTAHSNCSVSESDWEMGETEALGTNSALHSVQCAVQCAVCSVHFSSHSHSHSVCSLQCALQCAVCSVQYSSHSVCSVQCTGTATACSAVQWCLKSMKSGFARAKMLRLKYHDVLSARIDAKKTNR